MCGYTEPLLWIQLVAERSASKWRALGISITSARRVNVERSTFGLRRAKGLVESKKKFSIIKGERQQKQGRAPVKNLNEKLLFSYTP